VTRRSVPSRLWVLQVNVLAASPFVTQETRARLYRHAGMDLYTTDIRPSCYFFGPDITIGARSMVNRECHFENRERIEVGEDCFLGPEVMLGTSTHEIGTAARRAHEVVLLPVRIGAGCWLGARAIVLPGVAIAAGCVVAAGAVVVKSTEPDGLYAGVPARRRRDLQPGGPGPRLRQGTAS
jgi:maltose O-acetyltransferase